MGKNIEKREWKRNWQGWRMFVREHYFMFHHKLFSLLKKKLESDLKLAQQSHPLNPYERPICDRVQNRIYLI